MIPIIISVLISVTLSVLISNVIITEGVKRMIDFTSEQLKKTDEFWFKQLMEHIDHWHRR